MTEARELDPIFPIFHQFNEFVPPDEGFDANTDDDIESRPTSGGSVPSVQSDSRSTVIEVTRSQEGHGEQRCQNHGSDRQDQ
jgi:hypothetical protein